MWDWRRTSPIPGPSCLWDTALAVAARLPRLPLPTLFHTFGVVLVSCAGEVRGQVKTSTSSHIGLFLDEPVPVEVARGRMTTPDWCHGSSTPAGSEALWGTALATAYSLSHLRRGLGLLCRDGPRAGL